MAAPSYRPLTVADYLAAEAESQERLEFLDGAILAMAGGSAAHVTISGNVIGIFYARLRGTPCYPLSSDARIRTSETDYVYADATLVCGTAEFTTEEPIALQNPTVVVEVLSPSTEARDRGEKFAGYRSLPSVQEILFVAQVFAAVDHYRRGPNNTWILTALEGMDAVVEMESVGLKLPLAELYERVEFPPRRPFQSDPDRGN